MTERLITVAAVLLVAALWASGSPKPAADASPVVAGSNVGLSHIQPSAEEASLPAPAPIGRYTDGAGLESSRASIAPTPATEDRSPAVDEGMSAAGFVDHRGGSCGGSAKGFAAAPVRFLAQRQPLRRAFANRPRLFGRRH